MCVCTGSAGDNGFVRIRLICQGNVLPIDRQVLCLSIDFRGNIIIRSRNIMECPFNDIASLCDQKDTIVCQHIRTHDHIQSFQSLRTADGRSVCSQRGSCRGIVVISQTISLFIKAIRIINHSVGRRVGDRHFAVYSSVIFAVETDPVAAVGMLEPQTRLSGFEIESPIACISNLDRCPSCIDQTDINAGSIFKILLITIYIGVHIKLIRSACDRFKIPGSSGGCVIHFYETIFFIKSIRPVFREIIIRDVELISSAQFT